MGFKRIIIPAKGLNQPQINRLVCQNYRYASLVPIGGVKQEPFLIKPMGRESAVHVYVVETIRQFLISHNLRPRRWITKGVGLSVRQQFSKRRLTIEVETGLAYKKNKERLKKKFFVLQQKFDVVIVLTDSYFKKRYQTLFPLVPILLRQEIVPYLESRLSTLGYPRERHKYYYAKPFVPYEFMRRKKRR